MQHVTGMDVDITLGTTLVNVKQFSLTLEDGTKAAKTRGVPHGFVRGAVSAKGEITVDTENFNLIIQEAIKAGSFQSLSCFDITALGRTADQTITVKAFGCKLNISKLLDASGDGEDKLEHSFPYEVTDERFVMINGIPYLDTDFVKKLGFA